MRRQPARHLRRAIAVAFLVTIAVGGCPEGEGDEEGGTRYELDETLDEVRDGARLILGYDAETNTFDGTVENVAEGTLERVRVEVHLSNGTELGPTTPNDLAPGDTVDVELVATEEPFEWWSAHAEIGSDEHGEGCGGHGHE
jgi:hypothetical protein